MQQSNFYSVEFQTISCIRLLPRFFLISGRRRAKGKYRLQNSHEPNSPLLLIQ